MADALHEVAPASDEGWRKVGVVTVALEISNVLEVTYARGWLEKRLSSRELGLASERR